VQFPCLIHPTDKLPALLDVALYRAAHTISLFIPSMNLRAFILVLLFTSRAFAVPANEPEGIPAGYQLVYSQDFTSPAAMDDFIFTDPGAWKVSQGDGKSALELVKQSAYQPTVRSPVNIALIKDKVFGDFVLEVQCLQTGKEYGHRDMCVFYGFQSPSRFYYTHVATAADDHAHNCFIVNDAPRAKFARETTKGVNWGLGIWHKLRVERKASTGTVSVWFDDMNKPIMTGEEKTFGAGGIGFGSFDDTGKISNLRIWAKEKAETKALPPFPAAK
jgi:hypothetical protein